MKSACCRETAALNITDHLHPEQAFHPDAIHGRCSFPMGQIDPFYRGIYLSFRFSQNFSPYCELLTFML